VDVSSLAAFVAEVSLASNPAAAPGGIAVDVSDTLYVDEGDNVNIVGA
jgi:hypothetical protein